MRNGDGNQSRAVQGRRAPTHVRGRVDFSSIHVGDESPPS